MTREIRTESGGLFGADKEIIYEDGVRVGEIRHETEGVLFSERPVDRTYDNSGKLVSETYHGNEGVLFSERPVDRTYDPDNNLVSKTYHGTEGVLFSERPVDRTYDKDDNLVSKTYHEEGTFLGGGAKKVISEIRSQNDDLTGIVNNSSSSGYPDSGYHTPSPSSSSPGYSSPGSSVNSTGCLIALLGGIALIAAPLATIGLLISLAVKSGSYMYDFCKNGGITRGLQSAEQTFDYYKPRVGEGIERLFESDNSPAKRNLPEYPSKQNSVSIEKKRSIEEFRRSFSEDEIKILREGLQNRRGSKESGNVERSTYETPSKRRETIKIPIETQAPETQAPRKTSPVESKEERVRAYSAVLPSSEFSQSTTKNYAPVVVRVEGADGNKTIKTERRSKQDMKRETSDDIGITYPVSGKRYAIERVRYPELFDRLDLDRDGGVSLYELGEAQSTIFKITQKKKEGDLDAVVKEFLKKYKPKKQR